MAPDDDTPSSDYELVGGGPAVSSVVARFYDLVLADGELEPFFAGVDMTALKRHQVLLVSQAMGGPSNYDGRDLKAAHAGLGIGPDAFAAVVAHLVTALKEASVPDDVIGRVGAVLQATQVDIVTTASN